MAVKGWSFGVAAMILLLKWCLCDYRKYKFKTLATFVGLVFSLSLFLVIELYTGLLTPNKNDPLDRFRFPYKLINTRGYISTEQVNLLLKDALLEDARPFCQSWDKIEINGQVRTLRVLGVDTLSFLSEVDSSAVEVDTESFEPLDLNQVYYIDPTSGSKTQSWESFLSGKKGVATVIKVEGNTPPFLLMDIALFHHYYKPINRIDALLLKKTEVTPAFISRLRQPFPDLKVQSLISENEEQSKWTQSLRYNLNFLALIAMVVGAGLMLQFFRFIAYQRFRQIDLLFKLGVSKLRLTRVIGLESLIIAVLVLVISLVLAHVIAILGLSLFTKTLSTFYLQLDPKNLNYTPSIIFKIIFTTIIVLWVSYVSITQKLFRQVTLKRPLPLLFLGLAGIASSLLAIQFRLPAWALLIAGAVLILSFYPIALSFMMPVLRGLKKITAPKWLFVKMSRVSLGRDLVSYGLISFVIGISLSLVICMGIFVDSFRSTVSQWLYQVINYDFYLEHQENDLQLPIPIPIEIEKITDKVVGKEKLYKISRIPLTWEGVPCQVIIVDDRNSIEEITKEGPQFAEDAPNIAISEPFARKHNLRLGDRIELAGIIPVPLNIASIYYDFTSEFGVVRIKHSLYQKYNPDPLSWHAIAIEGAEDIDRVVFNNWMNKIYSRGDLSLESGESLKKRSLDLFEETFAFTWFVVFLISTITLIAMINVLTIICVDRRQELKQLWMMGANRLQLSKVLLGQLAIILIIGVFIAAGLGYLLFYFLIQGIQEPYFHWSIFTHIPWGFILTSIGVVLLMGFLCPFFFIKLNIGSSIQNVSDD